MIFRFIHTADWQLGKPFASLPSDLAAELAAARFAAIGRIADAAVRHKAAHILVAGDVFDNDELPSLMVRRAFERMAERDALTWVLLPGNHDPHRRGRIWDRAARIGLPANVIVATADAPIELSKLAVVLPAPLTTKNPGRDPTAWMDTAETPQQTLRIGLAHGSVQAFGSDGDSAVSIDKNRAQSARLDYLALGDWHGTTEISARTWYAGTPEPDRFPQNRPGNVLAVSLSPGAPPGVEIVKTAEFEWLRLARDIASVADLAAIERDMLLDDRRPAKTLVQLVLAGSLSMRERAELSEWHERWQAKLRLLDLDTAKLTPRPDAADFDTLGQGPAAEAARRLAALAADPANPEGETAARALERLFGFVAEAAREADA